MKQEIIRSEYEPEKKFLWLHTKDGNLVLEAFGDQGWESVGNEADNSICYVSMSGRFPSTNC